VNYNHLRIIIIPRTIESTLRTMNNLLERLHASFFFYIMTGPQTFLKIGYFLPSAILISVAMMFHGLSIWVNAAWIHDINSGPTEKKNSLSSPTPPSIKWKKRRRPVIAVLGIMISTHILGLLLFWTITRSWFMDKYQVGLFIIISFIHIVYPF
jgi:GPI-anchor transamidase subunit GAA1